MMSWASYFVRFGSALFVLPLLLKIYSPVEQSFWFFINTITGFAMLADSGFGNTLVRAVSYFKAGASYLPRTKKEYDEIEKIEKGEPHLKNLKNLLTTANRIYIYLGLFSVLILATGGIAAAWNIMELADHRTDIWIAYLIVIPYCYFMILSVKWSSFMRGLGYMAEEARFGVFQGVLRVIAFVILLLFQLGPAYLIFVLLLESVIKLFYIKWFVGKWFKKEKVVFEDKKYFDKDIFRSLWSATWRTGLLFWGAYAIQSGTSILASQLSDAVVMANFLLTMRIFNFILNIARAPFYTNVPKIYQLAAEKDLPNLRRKSSEYMFLGLGLKVAALAVLAVFGNQVLDLLGIETRFVGMTVFLIMAVTEILDLHASFHATIYTSTNHIPFVLPATISGGLILLVGFQVIPQYGVMGIVLTKFIIQFMFNNWYAVVLSLKLLRWNVFKYLYQFPYFGISFFKEILLTNVLNRK
jgi:O-antigen/teichoic acid export membrane protein